jgi:hypothetical protein
VVVRRLEGMPDSESELSSLTGNMWTWAACKVRTVLNALVISAWIALPAAHSAVRPESLAFATRAVSTSNTSADSSDSASAVATQTKESSTNPPKASLVSVQLIGATSSYPEAQTGEQLVPMKMPAQEELSATFGMSDTESA